MSKVDCVQVPEFEAESPGYEDDFAAWSLEQARRLRMMRIPGLDIENVAEEIESLGRSDKRALRSHTRVLLVHLLKWRYQHALAGPSWEATIVEQRRDIQDLLEESPSLWPTIAAVIDVTYKQAVTDAARETRLPKRIIPSSCEWSNEQVFDPDFFPDPVEPDLIPPP